MRASAKRGGRLPAARQEHARSEQCEGRGSPPLQPPLCMLSELSPNEAQLETDCGLPNGVDRRPKSMLGSGAGVAARWASA